MRHFAFLAIFFIFAWQNLSLGEELTTTAVTDASTVESNASNTSSTSNTNDNGKEMVIHVLARRRFIHKNYSTSSVTVDKSEIQKLPGGDDQTLPQLITTTTPGVIAGPFGQMYFRGNHANIQYELDGVQLPDSPSNTFGEAFSPRNIDHMEVITGGIPAEFGQRLAAVVNIVTKTGPEKPGGTLELNYGSYNTFSPVIEYGGSNKEGNIHYYFSANYTSTDRGLDTPEPKTTSDFNQGGTDAIHDYSQGNEEFAKIDDDLDNTNKLSLVMFNNYDFYQIPNYPSQFNTGDPMFRAGFTDPFGNTNGPGATAYNFVPYNTDDWQSETNSYVQAVWRHTFNDHSFMYLSPYYKYSEIVVGNDPTNDLATAADGTTPIPGATPSSFAENRHVNNYGLKGDFTDRPDNYNVVKYGFQSQFSQAAGDGE